MNSQYTTLVETLESRQLFSATVDSLSFAPAPNPWAQREEAPVLNSTADSNGSKPDDQGMKPNRPRVAPPGV